MAETQAAGPVAGGLRAALDDLLALDPGTLDDTELAGAVVEVHRQQARLAAAASRLTAALEARRIHADDGPRSAGAWLAHRCRLPLGQARAEVWLGRRLRHMPAAAAALAAGDISPRHAAVLAGLAGGRTAEHAAAAEEQLVDWARTMDWPGFCQAIEYWRQAADPDWAAAHGDTATACHLAPTPAQRRHDALVEMARQAMTAPADGKRPAPLVSVLVGYETFKGRVCQLANTVVVTPGTVASLLDDALIQRVIFDGPSRVIDLGRARRFTRAVRRALEIIDQRCGHPGCDQPTQRCQGDHVQPWSTGGTTTPDNGQLRCGYHNRWRSAHPDHDPPRSFDDPS